MASPTGSAGPSQSSPKPAKDSSAKADPPIKTIGKYEIQKKIGAGGMGAVYLAIDSTLRRTCALKVLPRDKANNPTLVKRFMREAQSAASLRHENIVAVYETGEADGYLYIALEYVDGTDLANLVQKRGKIPLKRSVEIVRQVVNALDHALQQGIVHRDIKPGNLLVRRDGVVKLADMGLARSLDDTIDTSITRAGTTVGTVDYMAPEQARDSKAADVRSDIYSLGCTWYYMLTGEPPFAEGSLTNKLRAHAESPIPDPRMLNPAVSEAVFGVLRRMTEKKPSKRYQTPKELLDDLEAASLTGDLVSDTIFSDVSGDDGEADAAAETRETGSYVKNRVEADSGEIEEAEEAAPRRKKSKAAKRAPAELDAGPAFKPPPGRDPEKKKLLEAEQPKRTNAPLFYALVGLVVFGIASGVVWGVWEFGMSSDAAQGERMANPFAARDAVAKNAGPAGSTKSMAGGSAATGAAAANSGAQPGGTTIGSPQQGAPGETVIGGQGGPGGGSGPVTTQIGGETTLGGNDPGNSPGTTVSGTNTGIGGSTPGTVGAPANVTIGGKGSVGGTSSAGGNTTSGGSAQGASATGDSGGGRKAGSGSRASSPQIAARTRQETAFLPAWVSQPGGADGLATLNVQADGSGEGIYATLNAALDHVPPAGAVIKLAGSGPFPLYPVKIADRTHIVVEPQDASNAGSSPLIVLLPPETGTAANFVEFSNTTLDFRRVHLALDAAGLGIAADDALLSAVSSDLYLRDCSLSVKGPSASPMTAVKITGHASRADGKGASQPRVLFDNTFVRGNSLTAVAINSEYVDLVLRNALVWSGTAASLRFGTIARSDADSARNVRLASATLCSSTCAVEIGGDASQPVPTSIELLNSLVATPVGAGSAAGNEAALLSLEGWNKNQQKTALGKFITWKSTASLYTGWATLIRLNPGADAQATSPAQWQAAWKEKGPTDKDQFQTALWPGRSIADIASVADFDELAPQTVGKQYVKTGEGGWPGCQTERLTTANMASLGPVRTARTRPMLPRGLFQSAVRNEIRVDVNKEDLGRFLERQQLQNGTQIIVSGSGQRQSSPILIENAWVRLQFEQTEGAPLVLIPKAAELKYDGFITVVNGGIEIVGAAFTMPASERQGVPKWFIQVIDSDLAMWKCRLQGALNGPARNKGLVQILSRSGRPPERLFEGSYDGYAWFDSCFLAGSGTMIEADTRGRALVVKNCVAVSRDDLFTLNVGQPDAQIASAVDVSYSTLSAADCFFQVRGDDLGTTAESPLSLVAECCVFAPPLRAGQQKLSPTLLSYSGPVLDQRQFTWSERRCGYTPEIAHFLRAATETGASGSQNFEKVWVNQWGTDQIVEPLIGVKGVVLQKDLPTKADERAKLEPGDFQLHAACRAAAWDNKRPIGAYLDQMSVPLLRGQAGAAEKKKPAKAAPATGGNPSPGF